jgi:hypothetical protein
MRLVWLVEVAETTRELTVRYRSRWLRRTAGAAGDRVGLGAAGGVPNEARVRASRSGPPLPEPRRAQLAAADLCSPNCHNVVLVLLAGFLAVLSLAGGETDNRHLNDAAWPGRRPRCRSKAYSREPGPESAGPFRFGDRLSLPSRANGSALDHFWEGPLRSLRRLARCTSGRCWPVKPAIRTAHPSERVAR